MDVASIAQVAVTSQAELLRQKLGIVALRQQNQAAQAVANVVAKAAGTSRGQQIDITA